MIRSVTHYVLILHHGPEEVSLSLLATGTDPRLRFGKRRDRKESEAAMAVADGVVRPSDGVSLLCYRVETEDKNGMHS